VAFIKVHKTRLHSGVGHYGLPVAHIPTIMYQQLSSFTTVESSISVMYYCYQVIRLCIRLCIIV